MSKPGSRKAATRRWPQLGALHAEKTRRYGALVAEGALKPRPGVLRLLQEARAAGVKLAIATTTDPANVEALLKASFAPDAPSWFSVIGAGDVVPAKKPAPDIYRFVLERLGCDPSACARFRGLGEWLARGARRRARRRCDAELLYGQR